MSQTKCALKLRLTSDL